MGVRAKNIAGLFKDVRTRTIIVITMVLLLAGIIVGLYVFTSKSGPATVAKLEQTPGAIESVPGSFNPTEQYAKLQQQQNVQQAQQAEKTGGSAIPTIIRATKAGEGQFGETPKGAPWQEGLGFQSLARVEGSGVAPKGLFLKSLKASGCSETELKAAIKMGVPAEELREAGCTSTQMRKQGFSTEQLQKAGYSACDLLSTAEIEPGKLRDAGYSAGELRGVGFNACQLKRAGYNAEQLCKAGFTPEELKGVGFTQQQIQQGCAAAGVQPGAAYAGGVPPGLSEDALRAAGCSPEAVRKARAEGITAFQMRQIVGCTASQLKAGGYTAKELKDAGFTAAELEAAGFTPSQLKKAGFSAADLLAAGDTPEQLKRAGFTPDQIKEGEEALRDTDLPPGVTLASLRKAGCGVAAVEKARAEGVSAKVMREIGCSASQLKAGGYTAKELKDAGFTAAELKAAGFTAAQLKAAGFTAAQLKAAGFTAKQLKDAGFTAAQLKAAGFTAKQLKDAGFTAAQLKAAGFTAKQLKDAGFTAAELKAAGFTPKQLKDAGFTAAELKDAGYSAQQLKNAGFTAGQLKDAGYSAQQLKDAGFSAGDLRKAGFNASQLKNAGYSGQDLEAAGLAPEPEVTQPSVEQPPSGLTSLEQQQQRQLEQQQLQQLQQQMSSAMTTQAGQLFSAWKPSAQKYVAGKKPKKEQEGAEGGGTTGPGGIPGQASTAPPLIKAGTILYAVMTSSVNSDYPGPVLATVVAGKYKGAKLIGSLTTFGTGVNAGKKVMITFTTMNIKQLTSAISINAYAIDPNTASVAMSDYTNNHYFIRYGSLFAASFLEGYGQAFLQSGQSLIATTGGVISTSPNLSPAGKVYVALGNVGNKFGTVLQNVFNMPPTVHVYSGTGIGVLFTSDVAQPTASS